MSNRQTLDEKLQYFHSLLLEEEINLYQFLKMTTQTTQNDVSKKMSREFKKMTWSRLPATYGIKQ